MMVKEKEKRPIKRKIQSTFKTQDLINLRDVMKRFGNRYQTGASVYSKDGDRLLIKQGGLVSEDRFGKMQRELQEAISKSKPSPYYTSQRTDYNQN
jgi:hypothetical protein